MDERYGSKVFWENEYRNRIADKFGDLEEEEKVDYMQSKLESEEDGGEWYGDFSNIYEILSLYLKPDTRGERILHLGCGTSKLAEGLWKSGWTNITNVDYSENAIEQARLRDRHLHGIKYVCTDCTNMQEFKDSSFDYIIEKGMMDAMFCSVGNIRNVKALLSEVSRLLKPGGFFISFSCAPQNCRFPHLIHTEYNWSVDSVRVPHDPGYFAYACNKRSFHKEWFFPDPAALQVKEDSKRVYRPPLRTVKR